MNRSTMTTFNPTALRTFARATPMLLIALLQTACAATPQATAPQAVTSQTHPAPQWDPEQVAKKQLPKITTPQQIHVNDRATARWKALLAGDFAKAYTFTTSVFQKSTTKEIYVAGLSNAQWHGAEVLTVTCESDVKCIARVRVDAKVVIPRTTMNKITTHVDEVWLLEDGQWLLSDDTPR